MLVVGGSWLAPSPASADPVPTVMLEYRIARVRCSDLEGLGIAAPSGARDRRAVVVPAPESALDLDLALSPLVDARSATWISRPMVMVQIGEDAEIESGVVGRERPSVRVSSLVTRSGEELSVHVNAQVEEKFEFEGDVRPPAAIIWRGSGGTCRIAVLHARLEKGSGLITSPR
jgi:hypothetical protein